MVHVLSMIHRFVVKSHDAGGVHKSTVWHTFHGLLSLQMFVCCVYFTMFLEIAVEVRGLQSTTHFRGLQSTTHFRGLQSTTHFQAYVMCDPRHVFCGKLCSNITFYMADKFHGVNKNTAT